MTASKNRSVKSSKDANASRIVKLVITPNDPRILINNRPVNLSRQQLTLLQLLAKQSGKMVSTVTLAKSLAHGRRLLPLTDTGVFVQVHRLRASLKSSGLRIRSFPGFGYLLEAVDEGGAVEISSGVDED